MWLKAENAWQYFDHKDGRNGIVTLVASYRPSPEDRKKRIYKPMATSYPVQNRRIFYQKKVRDRRLQHVDVVNPIYEKFTKMPYRFGTNEVTHVLRSQRLFNEIISPLAV